MNLLQAVGALLQQDLPLDALLEAISSFSGVPGRMERVLVPGVDAASLPTVLVDYAHLDGLDSARRPPDPSQTVVWCVSSAVVGIATVASVLKWRRSLHASPIEW